MIAFFRLCFSSAGIIRSLCISLVVGTLLVAINYGAFILDGNFNENMLFPAFLNYLVPFLVSKIAAAFQIKDNEH